MGPLVTCKLGTVGFLQPPSVPRGVLPLSQGSNKWLRPLTDYPELELRLSCTQGEVVTSTLRSVGISRCVSDYTID